MGNPHSKPEDRLRYINREVTSLRSSLRHSRQNLSNDKKEAIVESLAYQSGEISSMHGKIKQKKIDDALKNISLTMEEVLQIESRDLDMGAVESDSFVHMPVSKRRANSAGSLTSQKTTKTTQSQQKTLNVNRSSVPTIREIEAKFDDLKVLVSTAIDNKDTKQLRVYKATIEVLARDLEMIYVDKDTPLEQRKNNLMKKLAHIFQKITRSLTEIKRNDNIEYLSTQGRKDKATRDLADIELHLAENESVLDRNVKEKSTVNVGTIRNNIVQMSQKLGAVDIVDNEIKGRVIFLSQKLTEIVKNLDRTMAKKEFDSKFSKSLETYERTVKNFNGAVNAEATMNTLESLRNSVQNLEEINDTTKNRKKELLTNINKQINNLEEVVSDRDTIQQIVEDTVVLRKKVKSTDQEHTVIDQFINYWNNVKSNFNINAYSHLSLLRIDAVLEEMQQSMNGIRIDIASKCDTNPPTNLLRKHSQSVPKLNTRKSYGSSRSLDQLDSKIIKARAKVYNISTPELLKIQDQSHVNNRFSKIEEIKMQVHYIKEKIDKSHNKNLLREKLDLYRNELTQFYKDPNQTVANNAVIVSNEITELLYVLVLAEHKEKADTLIKKTHNFNGTRFDKEYDELKEEMIKVQVSMENFEIPEQYEELRSEKNQLLDEIFCNIQTLQEKTSFYKKPENENFKKIKANIQGLCDKVQRFSGTYKGVLYNQIERDLNKLLLLIGEQVEDKVNADEATKQVERLQKILEQRSSLAQSFRASKPETPKSEDQLGIRMTKIKNDLFNIKKEIDKTTDEDIDAFIGLQSRLDLVNFELSQIVPKYNENLAKEKDIFSNEAQSLKNIVDAKVTLSQQPMVQWPEREMQPEVINYPKNDINKEMEKLESKFQKILIDINAPNAGEDIHKYYKLAQDIRNLLEKLDQYKLIKGTDLHTRKIALLNEMQYYLGALEKEAKDADYVISIEKKVDSLQNILNSNQASDLKAMAKELQAIQSKLDNHNVNPTNETLRGRKTSVQQKTEDLASKLKQLTDSEAEKKILQIKEEAKKLIDIEEKVKALRPEVQHFVGIQSDSKFYELDETSMRLILVLDKFEPDNSDLQQRKIKLLKELHNFGQILDERAQQTQEVINLEQQLEEVSFLVQQFSGSEEQLTLIKQKLEKIGRKVQSVRVNKDLVSRKNACMERLSVMFNKIMTLVVSTLPPPLPPPPVPNSSSGYSSVASSSRTTITQHNTLGYTTQLYSFTDPKKNSASNDTQLVKTPFDSRLAEIEQEVKQLEGLLNVTSDIKKLEDIDKVFTHCTIELNNLNYPKDSIEYKIKLGLFQTIENLSLFIEEKLESNKQETTTDEKGDLDAIKNIEHEVDMIGNKMNTPLTDDQINELDERLIQLQVTLGKMNNSTLKGEIDACMMKIILYAKNISDYKQSVDNTAL